MIYNVIPDNLTSFPLISMDSNNITSSGGNITGLFCLFRCLTSHPTPVNILRLSFDLTALFMGLVISKGLNSKSICQLLTTAQLEWAVG